MASEDWRKLLCSLITMIYEGEANIEICKEFLCNNKNFNPYNLLNMIPQNDGVITPNDFYHCNLVKDLNYTFDDYYILIKQYSTGDNSHLTSKDFLKLIMPATNKKLKNICLNQNLSHSYILDGHTKFGFQTLIRKEIELQRKIENIKTTLEKLENFSIREAFLAIDIEKKGFIDKEDLFKFLRNNGIIINSKSFEDFFRRIKRENIKNINFEKFYDLLMPFRPNKDKVIDLKTRNSEKSPINIQDNLNTEEEVEDISIQDNSDINEGSLQPDINANEEIKEEIFENDPDASKKVLNYFILQLSLEREIENYRESLFTFKEFSIDFLFKVLDKNEELEISLEAFYDFLKDLNIDIEEVDLLRIFKKFGNDNVKLEDEGLLNLLSPLNDEYSSYSGENSGNGFSPLCIEILSKVLKLTIENEKKIAEEGAMLAKLPEDCLKNAFNAIDNDSDGIISVSDMKIALDNFGIYSTNKDIGLIMKRYKIYIDNGISYEAFYQSIAFD